MGVHVLSFFERLRKKRALPFLPLPRSEMLQRIYAEMRSLATEEFKLIFQRRTQLKLFSVRSPMRSAAEGIMRILSADVSAAL
jgi:hypothetical protein